MFLESIWKQLYHLVVLNRWQFITKTKILTCQIVSVSLLYYLNWRVTKGAEQPNPFQDKATLLSPITILKPRFSLHFYPSTGVIKCCWSVKRLHTEFDNLKSGVSVDYSDPCRRGVTECPLGHAVRAVVTNNKVINRTIDRLPSCQNLTTGSFISWSGKFSATLRTECIYVALDMRGIQT